MNSEKAELLPHVEDNPEHEYKFLITSSGTLFVAEKPLDKLKTLTHEDWVKHLLDTGKIRPDETVKGGYLVRMYGKLRFWGVSTMPMMQDVPLTAASKDDLEAALASHAIVVESAEL